MCAASPAKGTRPILKIGGGAQMDTKTSSPFDLKRARPDRPDHMLSCFGLWNGFLVVRFTAFEPNEAP